MMRGTQSWDSMTTWRDEVRREVGGRFWREETNVSL